MLTEGGRKKRKTRKSDSDLNRETTPRDLFCDTERVLLACLPDRHAHPQLFFYPRTTELNTLSPGYLTVPTRMLIC